jgi:hypothetical protein
VLHLRPSEIAPVHCEFDVVIDVDVVLQQIFAVLQVEPVGQALLMHAASIK